MQIQDKDKCPDCDGSGEAAPCAQCTSCGGSGHRVDYEDTLVRQRIARWLKPASGGGLAILRRLQRWQLRGPVVVTFQRPTVVEMESPIASRWDPLVRLYLTVRRGTIAPAGQPSYPLEYVVEVKAWNDRSYTRFERIVLAVKRKMMSRSEAASDHTRTTN